ncbi:hypothetical protein [Dactylosporangium sp. NPDC050588]|uniref:hypothetical protein n=1 Tax=Dactylosporangium sp. NPDC050588 TaxID=3157211 RepID=UPI0033D21795
MYEPERDAGSVAAMPLPGGGYGACQVTSGSAVAALAWWSHDPPTLDDLRTARPLEPTHHGQGGLLMHLHATLHPIPPEFEWLGHLPVPAELRDPPATYADWTTLQHAAAAQRRWDALVPAAARAAYLSGRSGVLGDFGAGLLQVSTNARRLDLTAPGAVPHTGAVDWRALDGFPSCTELAWSGADRGLAAALAARPCIDTLVWTDAPSTVDLSGTALAELRVTGPAVSLVRLPAALQRLMLDGAGLPGRIVAPGRLWLAVDGAGVGTVLPSGLDQVPVADLRGAGTVSVAGLREALPGLRSLRVRWQRPPGDLHGAAGLAGLDGLTVVELSGAYGLHADTLPDLPGLRVLTADGLRTSAAAELRRRHRGGGVRLTLRGAKSDTWLAANLDNPFRDWADDHPRAATVACKAYADAARAIAANTADPRQILLTMVGRFNTIHASLLALDTLRREQVGDAVAVLAGRAGVPADEAFEAFDF